MNSRRSRVRAFALAVALASCGGGASVGTGPSWRGRQATSDTRPRSLALALSPTRPGARAYNGDTEVRVAISPLEDAVAHVFAAAAASAGLAAPRNDARLFAVAEDLGAVAPANGPIPFALIEFAMRHYGLIEPAPRMLVVWGPSEHGEVILDQLRERVDGLVAQGPIARLGVGVVERGDSDVILVLLQPSAIELAPVPREIRGDRMVPLRAEVQAPYRNPELFVTLEDGSVIEPKLERSGGAIRAELSCAGRTGPQQVEITAVDRTGSQVLANFPVWCNQAPPARVEVRLPAADAGRAATEAEAEAEMLRLINDDRARAGLPGLEVDPALSEVARAHGREMRATGVVAHVSPTTGSAADRVRAARIRTAIVLENVARAYGVGEAQDGLMGSPGHRANILAADVTHVGIGIVFGDGDDALQEMFVTQVFMRIPPRVNRDEARAAVLARLGAAIREDVRLSAIAQEFAEAVAAGAASERASQRANQRLDELSGNFRRVTTLVNAVASIESFPVARITANRGASHVGIGIAQGPHAVIGERAIYVVALIAEGR